MRKNKFKSFASRLNKDGDHPEKISFAENENVFITYKDFVLKSKVIGSNIVEEYNLFKMPIMVFIAVSYTHLTLPTILRV